MSIRSIDRGVPDSSLADPDKERADALIEAKRWFVHQNTHRFGFLQQFLGYKRKKF
jgi:hypothetical protein